MAVSIVELLEVVDVYTRASELKGLWQYGQVLQVETEDCNPDQECCRDNQVTNGVVQR